MKITKKHYALMERHAQSMALGEVLTSWPEGMTYDSLMGHYSEHGEIDDISSDDDFIVYERYEDEDDDGVIAAIEGYRDQFLRQLEEFLTDVLKMESRK